MDPKFIFGALGALLSIWVSIVFFRAVLRCATAAEATLVESIRHNTLLDEQNDLLRALSAQIAGASSDAGPKAGTKPPPAP